MSKLSKYAATILATTAIQIGLPSAALADHISFSTFLDEILVGGDPIGGSGILGNPQGSLDSGHVAAQGCRPCALGETTSFSGELIGTFFGSITADDGRIFELGFSDNAFAEVTISSPSFVLQPKRSGAVSVVMPFNASGTLQFDHRLDEINFERVVVNFFGSGQATGLFLVNLSPEEGAPSATFDGASYLAGAANPVPEPATVVLLSTGLGGLLLRPARRR